MEEVIFKRYDVLRKRSTVFCIKTKWRGCHLKRKINQKDINFIRYTYSFIFKSALIRFNLYYPRSDFFLFLLRN